MIVLVGLTDAAAVVAGVYLTCVLRVVLDPLFEQTFTMGVALALFPSRFVFVAMWVWALSTGHAYDIQPRSGVSIRWSALARCTILATIGTVLLMFLMRTPREEVSRSLVILSAPVTMTLVAIGRALLRTLLQRLAGFGYGVHRVAIIGHAARAGELRDRVSGLGADGMQLVGFVAPDGAKDDEPEGTGWGRLGTVRSLRQVVNAHRIDRLVLADFSLPRTVVNEIALLCERMDVRLDMVADFLGLSSKRVSLWDIEGVPLISIEHRQFTRGDQLLKRGFDIAAAGVTTLALVPLLLLVALLIKLDSRGPIIYAQGRVGRGGRHFNLYKFRSMYVGSDSDRAAVATANEQRGHLFKIRNDPRVTRVGRWLRRFSIDELPQLVNVLKGEMSLVGPRPLPVIDLEGRDSDFAFWLEQRQKLPPGMTGLWQVGGRSELPFEEMVKYDLYYLDRWSLWLDAQILARTLPAVLSGKGAY